MISVVGHLDLPKLYAPLPACLADLDGADSETARRLSTLLEMIAERNLALDVNLSGLRKGVGIYPHPEILRRARGLGIPVAIGTDTPRPRRPRARTTPRGWRRCRLPATATTSPFPGASPRSGRCGPGGGVVPRPQPGDGDAQPPVRAREAAGDSPPLFRRRVQGAGEGLSRVLVPGGLPRAAGAQGGAVHHDHRPHARLRGRGDRLPLLPSPRPAGDARRAAEHPGLGGDQRRDGLAELAAGRHGHRVPHPGRARGERIREAVEFVLGTAGGPVPADRARGAHAAAAAEARLRLPPGGGRGVASHPDVAAHDRGRARQPARRRAGAALRAGLARGERGGPAAWRAGRQELRGPGHRRGRAGRGGRASPPRPVLLRGIADHPRRADAMRMPEACHETQGDRKTAELADVLRLRAEEPRGPARRPSTSWTAASSRPCSLRGTSTRATPVASTAG